MSFKSGNDFFNKGLYREALCEYEKIEKNSALYKYALFNLNHTKKIIEKNNIPNEINFKNPLVSVIVPVYNSEDFLCDCIDSLVNQTLKNVEFIFVDDGSTDSSLNILKEYKKKDGRVKVFHQENKYAGAARNLGLSHAQGEYIIFIDSDDFVNLELLEKCYKRCKEKDLDVLIFDACEFDTLNKEFRSCKFPVGKKIFPKKDVFNYLDIKDKIFQANSCIPWNKIFKKDLIEKSGVRYQEIKSSNDTVFIYSLLVEAKRMHFLDEILVYYRVNNPNSLQRSKSKSWECIYQAFAALKNRLEYIGVYESVKKSFVNKALRAFLYYMNTVDSKTKMTMEAAFANKYANLLDMGALEDVDIYLRENYKEYIRLKSFEYVPVVYASDINYLPHTYISMNSIIKNLAKGTKVVFYVMHDSSVSSEDIDKFERLNSDRVAVNFIDMNDEFKNIPMKIAHISYVTYFRLKIHEKLSFYDKVLYIDSDTIVKSDICKIYRTDINDYYCAGVKAIAFNNKKHQERLNIDVSNYINAGVILLNVKKIIESNVYKRFDSLLMEGFSCQDQDIINVAFNGKIKTLDKKFNFMTKYIESLNDVDVKSIEIIHFADKVKPWNDPSSYLAEFFWNYVENTPYCDFFIANKK